MLTEYEKEGGQKEVSAVGDRFLAIPYSNLMMEVVHSFEKNRRVRQTKGDKGERYI